MWRIPGMGSVGGTEGAIVRTSVAETVGASTTATADARITGRVAGVS